MLISIMSIKLKLIIDYIMSITTTKFEKIKNHPISDNYNKNLTLFEKEKQRYPLN